MNDSFSMFTNLPHISLIGGSYQKYYFYFYKSDMVTPIHLGGINNISFILMEYANPSVSIFEVTGWFFDKSPYNRVDVILRSQDTELLYGQFIYELKLKTIDNYSFIPARGTISIGQKISSAKQSISLYLPE